MADGFQIKIEGVKELQNTFKLIQKDILDVVTEAARDGGKVIKTNAKMKVHRISGDLAESIDELHVIKSDSRTEVQIGSDLPYATVEEFRVGGKYPGPHSYLRWSLDTSKSEVEDVMKRKISSQLGRYR